MTPTRDKKPPAPWLPAPYVLADASALQAIERGEADAEQQKRAMRWIIEAAADTYGMSFRPGLEGARDTDFAEGRRFVGQQVVKMIKLNLNTLRGKQ